MIHSLRYSLFVLFILLISCATVSPKKELLQCKKSLPQHAEKSSVDTYYYGTGRILNIPIHDTEYSFIKNAYKYKVKVLDFGSHLGGYYLSDNHIVFCLPVSAKWTFRTVKAINTVYVAGTFNKWNPEDKDWQMTNIEDKNVFKLKKTILSIEPGSYRFKFVVNGKIWVLPRGVSLTMPE